MKKYTLAGKEIEVIEGDITDFDVDALVNCAGNQMYMNAGVSGAIKRKGGLSIEDEAIKKGPVEVGSAITTKAGDLKNKYIIHAAVMGFDFQTDAEKIANATASTYIEAQNLKIKSIAFPALGTGISNFPLVEAAEVMFKVTKEKLPNNSIEKVIFALFGQEAYLIFRTKADEYFRPVS